MADGKHTNASSNVVKLIVHFPDSSVLDMCCKTERLLPFQFFWKVPNKTSILHCSISSTIHTCWSWITTAANLCTEFLPSWPSGTKINTPNLYRWCRLNIYYPKLLYLSQSSSSLFNLLICHPIFFGPLLSIILTLPYLGGSCWASSPTGSRQTDPFSCSSLLCSPTPDNTISLNNLVLEISSGSVFVPKHISRS